MGDEAMQKKRKGVWSLIISVIIPLAVGGVSAVLTRDGMKLFKLMNKPPLTPPDWVFPVVWTVLYVLMGLAAYWVYSSDASEVRRVRAMTVYAVQLGMNFFWSIIFFALEMYLTAFVWLVGMWVLIAVCMALFYHIDNRAGLAMLPYLVWTTLAGYLNMGVFVLN